jgi:hypothetical protein
VVADEILPREQPLAAPALADCRWSCTSGARHAAVPDERARRGPGIAVETGRDAGAADPWGADVLFRQVYRCHPGGDLRSPGPVGFKGIRQGQRGSRRSRNYRKGSTQAQASAGSWGTPARRDPGGVQPVPRSNYRRDAYPLGHDLRTPGHPHYQHQHVERDADARRGGPDIQPDARVACG